MTLILTIVAPDQLPEGQEKELRLDRHGAVIGRSHHADWRIHDMNYWVSSVHCEVDFTDGAYWLVDRSKNGTHLNGTHRMEPNTPHRIRMGDRFDLGGFSLEVTRLAVAAPPVGPTPASVSSNWTVDQAEVAPPIDPGKFSSQRLRPESSGAGALGQSFEPPAPKLEPPRVRGETPAEDIWTRHLAAIQTTPAAPAASAPQLVSARRTPEPSLASPTPASEPEPGLAPAPAMDTRAEELLRACIAGLRKLVEARARAKAELGAQTTVMDLHGNNPLKFAVTADAALAQMLQPPQRGFLDGPAAVDDAFNDIQAHQLATIAAMRDALRATIDRFSPAAIRGRVKKGFLDSLLPDARNAALWKAYEAEFEGVVKGSDEAFMDVFSREFLRAYEEAAHFSRRR